jgi:hypothetical protein
MSKLINYVFSGFFKQEPSCKLEKEIQEEQCKEFQTNLKKLDKIPEGNVSYVDLDKNLKSSIEKENRFNEYLSKDHFSNNSFNQSLDLKEFDKNIKVQ